MATELVFETHSISEDNERGIATGWLPGRLSEVGRALAAELGARRRSERLDAVFVSDLERAVETARIAFGDADVPVFHDWRLRECNYGEMNGMPSPRLHETRGFYIDRPYPGGESWRQATARIARFLADVAWRCDGQRVLVIGHVATRWGFDHWLCGAPLEDLVTEGFQWRPGWAYAVPSPPAGGGGDAPKGR